MSDQIFGVGRPRPLLAVETEAPPDSWMNVDVLGMEERSERTTGLWSASANSVVLVSFLLGLKIIEILTKNNVSFCSFCF
jgi:hypothetical protein